MSDTSRIPVASNPEESLDNFYDPSSLERPASAPPPTPRPFTPLLHNLSRALPIMAGVLVLIIIGTFVFVRLERKRPATSEGVLRINEQTVEPKRAVQQAAAKQAAKRPGAATLEVESDLQVGGQLRLANGDSSVTVIRPSSAAGESTLSLPAGSGTLCLDTNNCGYINEARLQAGLNQLQTLVASTSGASLVNGVAGSLVLQGTTNQVTVTTTSGVIRLSTPQDLAQISSPTFSNLLLNGNLGVGGTFNLPLDCSVFASNGKLTTTATGRVICANDDTSAGGGGIISGSGTANYVARFTGPTSLGTGVLYDNGVSVGIGTTAPTYPLSIVNSASAKLGLTNSSSGRTWSLNSFLDGQFYIADEAAGVNRLTIAASGNVGIGTTTPNSRLEVVASGVGDGIALIGSTVGGKSPSLSLYDGTIQRGALGLAEQVIHYSTDAVIGDIVLRATTGKLLLQTGVGASALAINGGNVGIGTTTPVAKLEVAAGPLVGFGGSGLSVSASTNTIDSGQNAANFSLFNNNTAASSTGYPYAGVFAYYKQGSSVDTGYATGAVNAASVLSGGTTPGLWNYSSRVQLNGGNATEISDFVADSQYGTTGSVNSRKALRVRDFNKAGSQTLTSQAGLVVEPLTSGINNTALLLGITIPTGNFGIYNEINANNFIFGNLGIGTTTPTAKLSVASAYATATGTEQYGEYINAAFNAADTGLKQGLRVDTYSSNTTGTLGLLEGVLSLVQGTGNGGTTSYADAFFARVDVLLGSTVTNGRGFYVENGLGAGTLVNQVGVNVQPLTKGTNNVGIAIGEATGTNQTNLLIGSNTAPSGAYSIYNSSPDQNYFAGNLGIGITTTGTNNKLIVNPYTTVDNLATAQINTTAASNKGLVVQGVAGQSANLFEVQNSTGLGYFAVTGASDYVATAINNQVGGLRVGGLYSTLTGRFEVVTGATNKIGQIIFGATGQTADLLQLQDGTGLVNGAFGPLGNQLTLGRVAAAGTVTQGKLLFSDGTNSNFGVTLQSAVRTGSGTVTIPNTGSANDTICLLSLANCGVGGGVGISGSGTLNYVARFTSASTLGTGVLYDNAASVGIGTTTPAQKLDVVGNVLVSGYVFGVGGLQINNASSNSGYIVKVAEVDTAGTVNLNDVVVYTSTGGANTKVTTTTTARDSRVYGVVISGGAYTAGQLLSVAIGGNGQVNVDTGAVAAGDQLVASATAGRATVDNNATTGIVGVATSSKAAGSNGVVGLIIRPVGGQFSPTFRNSADSTSAFQVQNAGGTNLLSIDSTVDAANLVTNPSFETSTTGWAAVGAASIAQTSAQSYFGTKSLAITTTAAVGDGAKLPVTLSPNTTYRLSFSANYSATSSTIKIGRSENGSTELNCSTTNSIGFGSWSVAGCSFTTGASVSGSYIYIEQNDATARTIYIDGVRLVASSNDLAIYNDSRLSLNGSITTPLEVRSLINTTRAFAVQNSIGKDLLTVNTNNQIISANTHTIINGGNLGVYSSGYTGGLPANLLSVNIPTTADSLATGLLATTVASNKGLVIQGVAGQTANLFEIQNSAGANLAGYDTLNNNLFSTNALSVGSSSPLDAAYFSVSSGSLSVANTVLRGATGQSADLLQLQDVNGNINAKFGALGNQLTLGRIAAAGTVTQGKLLFSDGTNSNFGITLQSAVQTGNGTVNIPNTAGAIDTICLQTLANCGVGGGGGTIGGSGTINYVARFTGPNTLGTGVLYDNGTNVGIGTTTPGARLSVQDSLALKLELKNGTGVVVGQLRSDNLENIGLGYNALASNTVTGIGGEGLYNSAFGRSALSSNTTGAANTATGRSALQLNTTGTNNTATGFNALNFNTTGGANTATGYQALFSNTNGCNNTATGFNALYFNSTGCGNTATGLSSLVSNTTGSANTALGFYAGYQDPNGTGFVTGAALQNTTTLGYGSQVQASNSLILGGQGTNQVNVGIGTTIPTNTLSVSPYQYSTGTITRTTGSAALVGTGTTFTAAMVGSEIIFADGYKSTVASFTNATSITMSTTYAPATDASSVAYRIHYIGLQVTSTGNVGIGTTTPAARLAVNGPAAQAGTGTVSTLGNAVNGVGTSFLTQIKSGDIITISGQARPVIRTLSDTSLLTYYPFSPDLSNASFTYSQPAVRITNTTEQAGLVIKSAAFGNGNIALDIRDSNDNNLLYVQNQGNVVSGATLLAGNGVFSSYGGQAISLQSTTNASGSFSGSITVQSADAPAGNSGNIVVDAGTATTTQGSISIGSTNASGISIGRVGKITTVSGSVAVNNLGIADSSTALCRNSLNQIAGCAPGIGSSLVQGGNSFGTTLQFGTNDNNGIDIRTNGVAIAKFSNTGQASFQNSTDSTIAFRIQNTIGTSLFTVDTTNNRLSVGPVGGDALGTLLVLGNKTTAGDPTGVNGATYYNQVTGKFRCYENNAWKDCIFPASITTKTADQPVSTTAYGNVNDLSFNVQANKQYKLSCSLLMSSAVNGGFLSMTGPASPLSYTATFTKTSDQSSGDRFATSSTYDDGNNATPFNIITTSTGSNRFILNYDAIISNGASAGTWQLRARAAALAGSAITIYGGSSCVFTPL